MIIRHLESKGYIVFKTLSMNVNGVPDILACSPNGQFVAIEVKTPRGSLSKLQEYWLDQLTFNNAVAFSAYNVEEVARRLKDVK